MLHSCFLRLVVMRREEIIEYALGHVCDLVPYDDDDYEERVMALAESYADAYLDNFNEEWESYGNSGFSSFDDVLPF